MCLRHIHDRMDAIASQLHSECAYGTFAARHCFAMSPYICYANVRGQGTSCLAFVRGLCAFGAFTGLRGAVRPWLRQGLISLPSGAEILRFLLNRGKGCSCFATAHAHFGAEGAKSSILAENKGFSISRGYSASERTSRAQLR